MSCTRFFKDVQLPVAIKQHAELLGCFFLAGGSGRRVSANSNQGLFNISRAMTARRHIPAMTRCFSATVRVRPPGRTRRTAALTLRGVPFSPLAVGLACPLRPLTAEAGCWVSMRQSYHMRRAMRCAAAGDPTLLVLAGRGAVAGGGLHKAATGGSEFPQERRAEKQEVHGSKVR